MPKGFQDICLRHFEFSVLFGEKTRMVDRIQYGRRLPIGKMCVHVFLTTGHMICGPEDTEKDDIEKSEDPPPLIIKVMRSRLVTASKTFPPSSA